MKIVKNDATIVCDIRGCNNIAKYKLIMDIGQREEIRICERCFKNFYKAACESIGQEEAKKIDSAKKPKSRG